MARLGQNNNNCFEKAVLKQVLVGIRVLYALHKWETDYPHEGGAHYGRVKSAIDPLFNDTDVCTTHTHTHTHTCYRISVSVVQMFSITRSSMTAGFVTTPSSVHAVWLVRGAQDSFAGSWSRVAPSNLIQLMNENWHLSARPNVSNYIIHWPLLSDLSSTLLFSL